MARMGSVFLFTIFTLVAHSAMATFTGTELVLPVAGRVVGVGGTDFLTTAFVTNLNDYPVEVRLQFLQAGQGNLADGPAVSDLQDGGAALADVR